MNEDMGERFEDLVEIANLAAQLFKAAEKDGLYVGAGHNVDLEDDEQEGPVVMQLKAVLKKTGRL